MVVPEVCCQAEPVWERSCKPNVSLQYHARNNIHEAWPTLLGSTSSLLLFLFFCGWSHWKAGCSGVQLLFELELELALGLFAS